MNFSSRKSLLLIALSAFWVMAIAPAVKAQTIDTGAVQGRVLDSKGAPLPGAVVRAKGPQGTKATETDNNGHYSLPFLVPGTYEVSASIDGFSSQQQTGVAVSVRQSSVLTFKLSEGTETVIVKATAVIDPTTSTSATRVDLSQAVAVFAQSRSFSDAFDFSPGVNTEAGVGGGNASISGASGMENQYIIGGINVTGAGFGTLGTYDQFRGASGSGFTTAFFDSLDIREGGFEAEYGGALGGVLSANVKSGGNDFHGTIESYYEPRALEGSRNTINYAGGNVNFYGSTVTDVALDFSGPIIRDKLFFFVGYNPTWTKNYYRFDIAQSDLAAAAITAPLANQEYDDGNRRSDNFAFHLGWNLSPKHTIDLTILSSPQVVNNSSIRAIGRRVVASQDIGLPGGIPDTDPLQGTLGSYKVTDQSYGLRYFGTWTPNLQVEAQVSRHIGRLAEKPGANADILRYSDQRRYDVFTSQQFNRGTLGVPDQPIVTPAIFGTGGLGFYQQGLNDETTEYVLKVTHHFNFLGAHEFKWGADFGTLKYRENVIATGPRPVVYTSGNGSDPNSYVTLNQGVTASILCNGLDPTATTFANACPLTKFRVSSTGLAPPSTDTVSKETNYFIQDKWSLHNLTLNLGVRYTSEKISNHDDFTIHNTLGAPLFGPFLGKTYSFKGEFSPRLGFAWDVLGNGKSKFYGNYSRLYERVPNDLAVRSFGNEITIYRLRFNNPDLTGQSNGLGSNPAPGIFGGTPTIVQPGTRLPYKDDFALGYSFEVSPRFTVDIKGSYRSQGRVLEDTQTATMEAIQNFYYNAYISYCTNCAPGQTDFFPGAGTAPFGQYVLANVGENSPTTFLDTSTNTLRTVDFGKPKSKYRAISVTMQKNPGEGEHLSLFASYRYSLLTGNYEGLFRNDNGQSDPNITSLFDFPNSPLARSLYTYGSLNTDSPHSLRLRMAYEDFLIKNLRASLTFKWQSGTLRTPLLAHPVYQNGGEIPGTNPQYYNFSFAGGGPGGYVDYAILKSYQAVDRGFSGRQNDIATWDAKLNYTFNLGKSAMDINIQILNLFNNTQVTAFDDYLDDPTGLLNPTYGQPKSVHDPRRVRLGVKWSF